MLETPEVVIVGRVCLDLYPMKSGVPLQDVATFSKSVGGSAANVAAATARHGHHVLFLTRSGDDPFGTYLVEELGRLGVDISHIRPVRGMQTVLTFCEMFPPEDPPIYIYRNPTAPDMYLEAADLPIQLIAEAKVFWATATGMSRQPTRDSHITALKARGRAANTILDLDYRLMFWDNAEHAREAVRAALPLVTVAIGNREECEIAVGETDPVRAADALLDRGIELAIVKLGAEGVFAKSRHETLRIEPVPVRVVNGLGSGDAFGGALCHGLLKQWPLKQTLQFANAAGAIVATRYECSSAMPTTTEVDMFLADHASIVA